MKKLTSLNCDNLKNYYVNLEGFLKHDNFFDLDLFSKLKVLRENLPKKKKKTATDILILLRILIVFPMHLLHIKYY